MTILQQLAMNRLLRDADAIGIQLQCGFTSISDRHSIQSKNS